MINLYKYTVLFKRNICSVTNQNSGNSCTYAAGIINSNQIRCEILFYSFFILLTYIFYYTSDNPLDCSTLCWFIQSSYASFDVTSPPPCAKPQDMTSYTWTQITNSPELLCDSHGNSFSFVNLLCSTLKPRLQVLSASL